MSELHAINLEESAVVCFESQNAGMGDNNDKSKKRRRGLGALDRDECHITKQEYAYKRSILSATQPSYLLQLGSENLRPENRIRLCRILQKLMRQHNWEEASGVLSILLRGTCKDKGPRMNRFKYTVSMELLKHMEFVNVEYMSIDSIYDTWMTRIGINVSRKDRRNEPMEEDRVAVRLESILFEFMRGNIEGERQNARSLMRENICDYPLFNVITGLIFYQLFYSSIPEYMQLKDSEKIHSLTNSDMSNDASNLDSSATKVKYEDVDVRHYTLSNNESESSFQYDSETSVMNGKIMLAKPSDEIGEEVVPMEVDVNRQRNLAQGFYVNSADNEASTDDNGGHLRSIPNMYAHESLYSWLLPLQRGECELSTIINDQEYEHAVRYLQAAVCYEPPSLAALLPLIQLLLIQYQFREALEELEKFCEISSAALPSRVRACLLEQVDPNNSILLSTSYEDTLKRDPTCTMSLEKLITMHQNGNYGPESLLEMIALHLDAVFAEHNVWREFAICFTRVTIQEQDCLSICFDGNEGENFDGCSVQYKIPKMFRHGKTRKTWQFRCRWWLTRHFSKTQLASNIALGDLGLITCKAACAAHMYGPGFDYVVQVHLKMDPRNNTGTKSVIGKSSFCILIWAEVLMHLVLCTPQPCDRVQLALLGTHWLLFLASEILFVIISTEIMSLPNIHEIERGATCPSPPRGGSATGLTALSLFTLALLFRLKEKSLYPTHFINSSESQNSTVYWEPNLTFQVESSTNPNNPCGSSNNSDNCNAANDIKFVMTLRYS